jgi:hypothetical protein
MRFEKKKNIPTNVSNEDAVPLAGPLEFSPVRNATEAALFAQYGPLFLRPNQWRQHFC